MTTSRTIRKRNEKFAAASSGIPPVAPVTRPRGLAASAAKSRSLTGKKWAISGHALFFMILLVGPAVLAIAHDATSIDLHAEFVHDPASDPLHELRAKGATKVSRQTVYQTVTKLAPVRRGISHMDDDDPTRQVLVHMTRLVELDLSGNLLRRVAGTAFPTCLTTLVLAANQLAEFPPVANLLHLVHLNLAYNRISDLDATTLTNRTSSSLKSLDLSFNRLSRLEPTVAALAAAPNVRIVSLMGNPIALATQYAETIVARVPHLVFFDDVHVDAGVRDGTPPTFVDTARAWLFIGSLWGLPVTPPPLPTAIHTLALTPATTAMDAAALTLTPSTPIPPPLSEYMYAIEIWDVATDPAPATFTSSAVPPITSKSTPKEKAAAAAAAAAAEAAGNGERVVKWNVLVEKTCAVDAKLRDTLADPLTMRLVRYWVTWDPIARDPPSPNTAKRAALAKKKGGAAAAAAAADASHDFRKVLHDRTVLGEIPIDVSELLDRNSLVLVITPAVGYGSPHATLTAELAIGLNGPPKDLVLPPTDSPAPGTDGTPPPVATAASNAAAPRVNAAALVAEFAKERETVAAIATANTVAMQAARDAALGASHGNGKKMGKPAA